MIPLQTAPEFAAKYSTLGLRALEFLAVTAVLYLFGRVLVVPLVARVFARRDLEPTLERTTLKLLRVGVTVGALAVGAATAGFGALLGGSALIFAALTLAVGFAAQDVLSNFVAGVFIVQDSNFNIDDWIEWEDNAGFIDDIGFRATRIRTFDNETVTVPNTQLATTAVTNRMSNERLRISYPFGFGYGDDLERATEILLGAAADNDDILADPEPSVRVTELGETAVTLQARFWIVDPDREEFSATRSAYIRSVKERCEAAGIDLTTTSQHRLSGEVAVADTDGGAVA